MGDTSKIEWTDATWNPVTGCTKVSPGCDHCYAEGIANRFRGPAFPNGFDVTIREKRLTEPMRWREPRRVFVNSMSDLFHEDIPDEYIARVFAVMAYTPQHTYQLLTKRHGRAKALLSRGDGDWLRARAQVALLSDPSFARKGWPIPDGGLTWPLPNVWLGVSVEDQKWADIRVPALLDTPAAVRFLSCEPLLGPLNLARYTGESSGLPDWARLIDWVIVGGESGTGARPMHPEWPRDLARQCSTSGVPFFFKQWGEWAPGSSAGPSGRRDAVVAHDGEWLAPPHELWTLDGDQDTLNRRRWAFVHRAGKTAAGRELDGRTWDEFPV